MWWKYLENCIRVNMKISIFMNSVKLPYHLSYLASLMKRLFRTARMLKSYKNCYRGRAEFCWGGSRCGGDGCVSVVCHWIWLEKRLPVSLCIPIRVEPRLEKTISLPNFYCVLLHMKNNNFKNVKIQFFHWWLLTCVRVNT